MSANDTYVSGLSGRDFSPPDSLGRLKTLALGVGVVAALISAGGFFLDRTQFFQSYLVGYVFWVIVALGCLAWLMINHLTAGTWGLIMRRSWEAGAGTLKLMIVLALPFLFGMTEIFSWADPEYAAKDELIQSKAAYLNVGAFWLRQAIIFAIWGGLAWLLRRDSARQDETGAAAATRRMRVISGPGLVLFVLTASVFSWDWLMSLEPHWFSSLYGIYFVAMCGLSGITFTAVWAWRLEKERPLRPWFQVKHFHDYGKLTLALTMFWAYMALSQFLIIWSGNVPEFVPWYLTRNQGGWKAYTVALIVLHFFLPFGILLSAAIKKRPGRLAAVCTYMLVMQFADLYWQAAPTWNETLTFHWLDVTTLVAVGGLWLWWFLTELGSRALLPINDPFIPEMVPHES